MSFRQRAFSKVASTYERYAEPQNDLLTLLLSRMHVDAPGAVRRIVDLGAGPGNSSAALLQRFPKAELFLVDYSEAMLAAAEQRLSQEFPDATLHFVQADLEDWEPPEDVDLAFSSSTLHWLDAPFSLLCRLQEALRPSGTLAVGVFGPRSFWELAHVFAEDAQVELPAQNFRDIFEWLELMKALFSGLALFQMEYSYEYPNLLTLLKNIRNTGTRAEATGIWTRSKLARAESDYISLYGAIHATLQYICFIGSKQGMETL